MTSMFRRSFLTLIASAAFALSVPVLADEWVEGEHYDVIMPTIRVGASDVVVVNEFFWYGCGHCYTFEPMLEAWAKQLPEGAVFKPSPAIWNGAMQLHAKAYYIAETLGVLEPMHQAIFRAMHVDHNRLGSPSALREVFVANGVDGAKFDQVFNSFGVDSQVRQADARARSAKITGTPSLMVNGKYLISASKAGSQANMLKVADFLVEKELAAIEKKTKGEVQ